MVSSLRTRAPPAQIQSPYRWKRSPAAGGAEAIAAPGGDGASIAQRYLLRACRGYPCPLCRLRAEESAAAAAERSEDAEKI